MAILHPKSLKETASQRLEHTQANPRQLVLIHTGAIVVLNLVINGLNLYLNQQISTTGGLSGLGMRSILETIQTLLGYFSMFFTPFWQAGFLFAMISIVRSTDPGPGSLFQGFRRFGRIMNYVFWQIIIAILLGIAVLYLVSTLFMMTPFSAEFAELATSLMESPDILLADGTLNLEILPMDALIASLIPYFIMYGLVMIPAYAFVNYHLRMVNFLMIESIPRGAVSSMVVSSHMMRGHKWQMLKLDLSFWWYYALEMLLMLVLYLDLLLPIMGINLPVDPTVLFFITLLIYGILELGLHIWKKPQVDLTYAAAYEAIYQEFAAKHIKP